MTSYLIWHELLPDAPGCPMYPVPSCDMVLPLVHSMWNSSKGGSDTATRLAWKCLAVVPIKTPQTVMIARLLMLYAVVLHRSNQAITGTKKPDVLTDTIQTIRERNNKCLPFYKTLTFLTQQLKRNAKKAKAAREINANVEEILGNGDDGNFLKKAAVRFTSVNASKRYEVDRSILGGLTEAGATPFG